MSNQTPTTAAVETNQELLRHANPGDVFLFFRPHRMVDYAYKLLMLSRYYHVAIYEGDGKVIEARPKGVGRHDLAGREGGYVVIPAPDGRGKEALDWAATQIGAGYDKMDNFVVALEHVFVRLHINKVPSGKYSCAEFIATAFFKAGIKLFPDRDLNDVEPKDFEKYLTKDDKHRVRHTKHKQTKKI